MEYFELSDEDVKAIIIKHKYDCMSIICMYSYFYVDEHLLKNTILINLFEEDDDSITVVFDYWNSQIDEWKELRSAFYVIGIKFLNEIMEDYYRTIINDKWADEVGEKYYY